MSLLKQPFMKLYSGIRGGINSFLRGTPRSIDEMLLKHGDKKVIGFEPRRRPIPSAIDWVINKATGGKSNEGKGKMGFDNFYHLWSNITLEDGTKLMTEKNERLYMKERHETSGKASPFPVNIKDGLTLREMMTLTERNVGSENLHRYHPVNANCQKYVTGLMASTGSDDPRNRAWVNQNVAEAIGDTEGTKWYTKVGQLITDAAGVVSKGLDNIGL